MLKEILYNILNDLTPYESKDSNVMEEGIKKRLDVSLELYYEHLIETCKFLISKNAITMLKGISREFNGEE